MDYNSDFRYDLKVGQVKEEALGNILNEKKIEIKYDLKALRTGNVFVEYKCRGKDSGITTSEADYYCFCIGDAYLMIETEKLRKKCEKYKDTGKDVRGGDLNKSKGILLPITELFK